MASTEPQIRHATREDVPAILSLIKELADYEHALSSVEATPETLTATIAFPPESTTPSKPARCLLLSAPSSETPVGMALYFYNYSTWRARPGIYLEDLYVTPACRNKGYGKKLLAALGKEVLEMGGGRVDWSVLKWNENSIRFYEDVVGATRMEEWVGMRVEGDEALGKLAKLGGGK